MNNYIAEIQFVSKLLRDIYKNVVYNKQKTLFNKSIYDEVTNIDFDVEKMLIDEIRKFDKNSHFLSEEFNADSDLQGKTWIIDPIDGTCNLTHGIETYGIQCALFDNDEIQLSFIYLPFSDELFTAQKNNGAKLNGKPIQKANRSPERAIISMGDFMHFDNNLMLLEHIMRHISQKVEKVRMYGAASIDFAYAACGRLDGNFTFVSNPWDIMPGILLCKEAGLIVTDAYGKPYSRQVAVFSSKEIMQICLGYLH